VRLLAIDLVVGPELGTRMVIERLPWLGGRLLISPVKDDPSRFDQPSATDLPHHV
jgi:hypothetical protein